MQSEKVLGKVLVKELEAKALGEKLTEENFWACHYALVKKYCMLKKQVLLRDGKTISAVEEHEKEFEFNAINIVARLPKYKNIFDIKDNKEFLSEYKRLLPKALPMPENTDEETLIELAGKVLSYAIRERLTSKDSGININVSEYASAMGDFERDSAVMTDEFLNVIEARFGEQGRENALSHIREEGMKAVNAQFDYYAKLTSYWCDFLANIEIAKQEEEDREWA